MNEGEIMENRNSFFDRIERKTNVKKEDILSLAKSIQGKNLKDEDTLRSLIQDVSKLAGKEVSKEKEDRIIEAVKKDKIPKNMNQINK
jgi:predicted transcriptional regulator